MSDRFDDDEYTKHLMELAERDGRIAALRTEMGRQDEELAAMTQRAENAEIRLQSFDDVAALAAEVMDENDNLRARCATLEARSAMADSPKSDEKCVPGVDYPCPPEIDPGKWA